MARRRNIKRAATAEEIIAAHHPRVTGYFLDPSGLIGFRKTRKTRSRAYPGSPRMTQTKEQTIVWYGYDPSARGYVKVGTSRSAGHWARYYRLGRANRR